MDKTKKIRAEIERRRDFLYERYIKKGKGCIEESRYDECVEILSFLDTLSEEPDESLEQEIETWIPAHINVRTDETLPINPTELAEICKEWGKCIARHFAEWQKSQKTHGTSVVLSSEDFQALSDSHTKRVEADYKKKMLADAVEGEVYLYRSYNRDASAILVDIPKENLGDKVKVIFLKAEEE